MSHDPQMARRTSEITFKDTNLLTEFLWIIRALCSPSEIIVEEHRLSHPNFHFSDFGRRQARSRHEIVKAQIPVVRAGRLMSDRLSRAFLIHTLLDTPRDPFLRPE
jgi:hypothetical protein